MKVLSVAFSMFLAAGFIQTAVGLSCATACGACWKNGSPGVDTKFACIRTSGYLECGNSCPPGYSGMHCAASPRCVCQNGAQCSGFGSCYCGFTIAGNGDKYCRGFNLDGSCQTG